MRIFTGIIKTCALVSFISSFALAAPSKKIDDVVLDLNKSNVLSSPKIGKSSSSKYVVKFKTSNLQLEPSTSSGMVERTVYEECSGALVDENVILTHASCVSSSDAYVEIGSDYYQIYEVVESYPLALVSFADRAGFYHSYIPDNYYFIQNGDFHWFESRSYGSQFLEVVDTSYSTYELGTSEDYICGDGYGTPAFDGDYLVGLESYDYRGCYWGAKTMVNVGYYSDWIKSNKRDMQDRLEYAQGIPPSPYNLVLNRATGRTLDISWSSTGGNTSKFELRYKLGTQAPGCSDGSATLINLSPSVRNHKIRGLEPNTMYGVSVCATNAFGDLAQNPAKQVFSTVDLLPVPPTPSNVSLIKLAADDLRFTHDIQPNTQYLLRFGKTSENITSCSGGSEIVQASRDYMNLLFNTSYSASICAFNDDHVTESVTVSALTENRPTTDPDYVNLSVLKLKHNKVQVNLLRSGIVDNLKGKILVCILGTDQCKDKGVIIKKKKTSAKVKVENLLQGTDYDVYWVDERNAVTKIQIKTLVKVKKSKK